MSGSPASSRLTVAETALFTAYLIHLYSLEKGKEVTRVRLSRDSVRWLSIRANLKEAFIEDWIEELASEWGWIAFPHGEEFGLVDASVVPGWVIIGTKRIVEDRQKLRRGDLSPLAKMRDALQGRKQIDEGRTED